MSSSNLQQSFVFLSTPTSGTGSLWRVISAIASKASFSLEKVAERFMIEGRAKELESWEPESAGVGYMYNTPHVINRSISERRVRLIVNFRDPRDMACNQYHWVFQHPDGSRTPEQLEQHRTLVRQAGIDAFVQKNDNNIQFAQFLALRDQLSKVDEAEILVLSYAQLCLDFDRLVLRVADFLGVADTEIPWGELDRERTENLSANPEWIGQKWTGTDTSPGRYRNELSQVAIAHLDEKYRDVLSFLRRIERQEFRGLLATEAERSEERRVLVGREGKLFLQADANDTPAQIEGRIRLSRNDQASIAMSHLARQRCGDVMSFRYAWAVAPSKEVALCEYLPEEIKFERDGPRPLRAYLESSFAQVCAPFYSAETLSSLDSPGYPEEDTHWNHKGAIAYLRAFLTAKWPDVGRRFDGLEWTTFLSAQSGDLGSKLYRDPERIEVVSVRTKRAKLAYTNGIANEGCVRHFVNTDVRTGARLLVLHDSFCMWWFDALAELFDEVIFVHTTIFDFGFIEDLRPTHVMCLQVERFLPRRPNNAGDLLGFIVREEEVKKTSAPFLAYWPEMLRMGLEHGPN